MVKEIQKNQKSQIENKNLKITKKNQIGDNEIKNDK